MLTLLKIALATTLVLMMLPATMLLRPGKREVAVHAVHTARGHHGAGPELVGVELHLWGGQAFLGLEKKVPL